MSSDMTILIVEDETMIALDLASAVEERGGTVAGPVATVADALALVETTPLTGAILDANLLDRDVTPVALALIDRAVPIVIHTGVGLPDELAAAFPHVAIIMKPARAETVVALLYRQIRDLGAPVADPLDDRASAADMLDRVTAALRDQFGDRSILIARRQAHDATDAARDSWTRILARLEA